MPKPSKREDAGRPRPPGNKPGDKPPRDTRENPAPNPERSGGLPETKTREDVEAIKPDLKC